MPEPSAATEARPDLSALDRQDRIRIALAGTQGHVWWRGEELVSDEWPRECWRLGSVACLTDGGRFVYIAPDPLTHPAAWGAVLEKERIDIQFDPETDFIGARARGSEPVASLSIGMAVAVAVLHKYGVPVPE